MAGAHRLPGRVSDDPASALQDHPIWQQDHVTLHSVGIDIGSSGTQVAFSRLHLRRMGEDLTSRYVVVRRETLHQSPVRLTPYVDERRIDAEAVGALVDDAYAAARQDPGAVDTGVVILTGEALRRDNAGRIATILADRGGDLVCATAGHHMEAMLAAYGSGAARASHDAGTRILTVDIGGGTTKLAIVDAGRVLATAALAIGGRLQVVDGAGRIVRLEPSGRDHATHAGFSWSVGDTVEPAALDRVAEGMADALISALAARPLPERVLRLFLTDPLWDLGRCDGVVFSGGVAEYVYGRESRDFGDLGRRLGTAVRRHIDEGALPAPLLPAGECIRATVLGASEYSVQLSGNTATISDPDLLLPRRNLQVVTPEYALGEVVDADAIAEAVGARLAAFDLRGAEGDVALALHWEGVPSYRRVLGLARGVAGGLAGRIVAGLPLYLVLDGDVALTLGALLRDELAVDVPLLVIDGVELRDFDYVDLGRLRQPSGTVPVTIKSLVFNVPDEGAPGPVR